MADARADASQSMAPPSRTVLDQLKIAPMSAIEWHPEKITYGADAYSDRSLAAFAGVALRANPLH